LKPYPLRPTLAIRMASRRALPSLLLCATLAGAGLGSGHSHGSDIDLPELGDGTSGIVSLQQEKELGTAWLASFRRQVKTVNDPLLEDYLEDLIYRLVTHSELKERDLQLVVVNNNTINAFAVPGGVIGVHDGLLQYAQNEDQLAAVLAHELGHLSQRHFARELAADDGGTAGQPGTDGNLGRRSRHGCTVGIAGRHDSEPVALLTRK
jgi:beta-barrel assembly-enhancing protease